MNQKHPIIDQYENMNAVEISSDWNDQLFQRIKLKEESFQKSNDSRQKFTTNNYGGIIGVDHLIKSEDNDTIIGSAITINKAQINDDLKKPEEKEDNTRYGDWVINGRTIDF